uniref:MCF.2 cell line derived transforming sequence like n=1 Tax=Myripristis murdjan TaxID=586833 RepID=A0A668A1Q9_9TELE
LCLWLRQCHKKTRKMLFPVLHYEIMQQESSPLRAAEIIPDLKKNFAFLSGGRGHNGSPIIMFPEFPAFGEITEREFHNVLTYLTSVPSLSATGVGFILVIDRRQDRWAAVKGTLLRIAVSFSLSMHMDKEMCVCVCVCVHVCMELIID